MDTLVCVKQVPNNQDIAIDEQTGALLRGETENRLNPYDRFAIEAALRVSEGCGGRTAAMTMGPPSAAKVLREAFAMGVDRGILVSDKAFAGADVFATAYTLAQAIERLGGFDLIFCGKITTDGATSHTGTELAAHLGIACLDHCAEIVAADKNCITVVQELSDAEYTVRAAFPCVVVTNENIYPPRWPTLQRKLKAGKMPLEIIGLAELPDTDSRHYGIDGSPTRVEKTYPAAREAAGTWLHGSTAEKTEALFSIIRQYREKNNEAEF